MKTGKKTFSLKLLPMDFARIVCSPLLLIYRMKRLNSQGDKYTERLKGGAIIAANHTSMQDPFLVGVVFWYRRLFFLAAEAVMGKSKIKAWLLKEAGAIKIDRNAADIEAINKAADILKSGRLLSVFPQGEIKKQEQVNTIKSGAVLIALRAKAPIIPIYIKPKKHWYSRRVAIIGEVFNPQDYISGKFPTMTDIDVATKALEVQMKALGEKF